jgi:CheY-like chemotaxis protein
VKVANNGREAVEILSSAAQTPRFDVVLMDVQMPEMDGYQATAKLRSDARFAALPIIAMTAHATLEERQRCLAVGMNDHISKPIDPSNLFETVGRFYKPQNPSLFNVSAPVEEHTLPDRLQSATHLSSIEGLDTNDGLARVAGNETLYLKLLQQFVEQQGPVPAQVAAALSNGDSVLAERLAHTLKGVAGNIGASQVQSAAATLEKLICAKAGVGEIESARHQATAALAPLIARLQEILKAPTPEPPIQAAVSTPVNPLQSREAAAQLLKLLSEFDPGAADFIETNRAALCPLLSNGDWPRFENLTRDYMFADARAQLEQALMTFPSS